MLIDINASFGGRESIQRFDQETMDAQLHLTPVSVACIHSHEGAFDQASANRRVEDLCAANHRRLPVAAINPRDTFVWREELDRCRSAGVKLFRITPAQSGWPVDSLFLDLIVERLAATGAILMVDATTAGLASTVAPRAAAANIPVIFTESRYFPLTELLPLAQRYPNVLIETSRMTSPDGIALAVSEIGAERILYGSGTCRYPAWVAWQTLERAPISAADRESIAWRNAAQLLDIDPPPPHIPPVRDAVDMPAWDIHLHDKFPGGPFPPFSPQTYQSALDGSRILGGVCSSFTAIFHDLRQGNDETATLLDQLPNVWGYVVVDPRYPDDSRRELQRLASSGKFVGIKIHAAHAKTPTRSPAMKALFEDIAPYRLPVLIHNLGEDWPEALVTIARRHPDLPIIAAHSGYGDAPHPTHDAALRVAGQPNIFIEFCSTYLAPGAIRRGIEAAGADRVLFGSDFPLIALPYMRAAYLDAELSDQEAMAIYRTNPLRLFPALGIPGQLSPPGGTGP